MPDDQENGREGAWLTKPTPIHKIETAGTGNFFPFTVQAALPPRSTAGQLTLDQHIGVRIPGGQPNFVQPLTVLRGFQNACR
jgi:hypothetical protein